METIYRVSVPGFCKLLVVVLENQSYAPVTMAMLAVVRNSISGAPEDILTPDGDGPAFNGQEVM